MSRTSDEHSSPDRQRIRTRESGATESSPATKKFESIVSSEGVPYFGELRLGKNYDTGSLCQRVSDVLLVTPAPTLSVKTSRTPFTPKDKDRVTRTSPVSPRSSSFRHWGRDFLERETDPSLWSSLRESPDLSQPGAPGLVPVRRVYGPTNTQYTAFLGLLSLGT